MGFLMSIHHSWITQKSASMTMEDIQVAADTHMVLSLTRDLASRPDTPGSIPCLAQVGFLSCEKQLGLGDDDWVV